MFSQVSISCSFQGQTHDLSVAASYVFSVYYAHIGSLSSIKIRISPLISIVDLSDIPPDKMEKYTVFLSCKLFLDLILAHLACMFIFSKLISALPSSQDSIQYLIAVCQAPIHESVLLAQEIFTHWQHFNGP